MNTATRWKRPEYDMNDPVERATAIEEQTRDRYFALQGRITRHMANLARMGNPSIELLEAADTARHEWREAIREHKEQVRLAIARIS